MATTTSSPSAVIAVSESAFTNTARLALAGYAGLTRDAYALGLRQYASWCISPPLPGAPLRTPSPRTAASRSDNVSRSSVRP
jgi:hypothetical protein